MIVQIITGCFVLIVIMIVAIAAIKNIQKLDVSNVIEQIAKIEMRKSIVDVDIKQLTTTAKIPTQEHDGDLYDVYADEDATIVDGESKLVSTGVAFSIPYGYQLRLYNRSSGPLKCKLVLSNGTGIVDTQYTGEIKGQFFCIKGCYQIKKGDKIMQLEIVRINKIRFNVVDELPETSRGAGGFGSTGK